MLELPEILTLASQLKMAAAGKTVRRVLPPTKVHKFCWFSGDPASYDAALRGQVLRGAITKEAYLGGSVYYCPACQKL